MGLSITVPPTAEPVTAAELKSQLRLDTVDSGFTVVQTIPPNFYTIGTISGSTVNVAGTNSTIVFNANIVGTNGTLSVKVQDSVNGNTWFDVYTFPEVNADNDNTSYDYLYVGDKMYIRAIATVAVASSPFGVDVHCEFLTNAEDDFLNALISAARSEAEIHQRRCLMPTTFLYTLDHFPTRYWSVPNQIVNDITMTSYYIPAPNKFLPIAGIILPVYPIQSVSISYLDISGNLILLDPSQYTLDSNTAPARIVPAYSKAWAATRATVNAVRITIVAGYTSASVVPNTTKVAIKMLAAGYYEQREGMGDRTLTVNPAVSRLLNVEAVNSYI
jgi:hypothetical protein